MVQLVSVSAPIAASMVALDSRALWQVEQTMSAGSAKPLEMVTIDGVEPAMVGQRGGKRTPAAAVATTLRMRSKVVSPGLGAWQVVHCMPFTGAISVVVLGLAR